MYAPPKASLEKDETDSRGPEFYVVSLRRRCKNSQLSPPLAH
ncbi:Membrane protein [Pseudomonas amygdali pv. morsprunorum]|nr:Membrane protein [Pseudomonas amygdali pv. morsprunorum]